MKLKIVVMLLVLLTFSSCSSRKAETQKKVEKLEELTQNDIKAEQSAAFESATISKLEEKKITATSKDPEKPSSLNITGNTVSWQNATVDFTNKKEDVSNTTTATANNKKEDNSKASKDAVIKDKSGNVERVGASWGANLGLIFGILFAIIVIGVIVYLKMNTPKT